MKKCLHFLYEWIGPRGPIINTKIPDVYDLAKSMHNISWSNTIVTEEVSPISMFYRNHVPTKISSVYELGNIHGNFIYELTMSWKKNFENTSLQSGIGVFENVPIHYAIIESINKKQGWLLISNHHESFVNDDTINKITTYLNEHKIDLSRVIYLSNCMNGQEIYERYCNLRNISPKINFEYAGIYLFDHINKAEDYRLIQRKYVIRPREKTFLIYNRRYRSHRFTLLLNLYIKGILDKSHISFAKFDGGESWIEIAKKVVRIEEINISDEELETLFNKLPFILDNDNFSKFPMENDLYSETVKFYDESLIHVTTETNFKEEIIHITEKTMKPILFKQPFIHVGPRHSLKYLKKMGFKTFNDLWDESYDDELNSKERMKKIINLMQKIDNFSEEEKVLLQHKVKDIVEFNFEKLRNYKSVEIDNFLEKYGA